MKEYTIVYDEKNHERKYIRYEAGIPIILSKDIVIDECNKEIERLKTENKELGRDYSRANNEFLRLNNIINEFNSSYSKIIKECEEMINDRYYMNENAIKYHADRIRDIAKYYIEEPKWQELKGSDKE